MASHFVAALGIASLSKTKKKIHGTNRKADATASSGLEEEVVEFDDEFDDVDMSMDSEAMQEAHYSPPLMPAMSLAS